MIEDSYVDYSRCEGIENNNFAEKSFYEVLGEYGIQIKGGEEKIGIIYATEEESRLLKVNIEQFLYHQSGIVRDQDGNVTEFFKITARPDQIQYTNILKK